MTRSIIIITKKTGLIVLVITVFGAVVWLGWQHKAAKIDFRDFDADHPDWAEDINRPGMIVEQQSRQGQNLTSPRIEFEKTDDLYSFVRKMSSPANVQYSDSLWLISKAIDYCYSYGMDPVGFGADTKNILENAPKESFAAIKVARDRTASRCRGFQGSDERTFSTSASLVNKVRAAKAGSLAAEAALITQQAPLSTEVSYLNNLAQRILESRDPEAYLAISDAMGISASGYPEIYGAVSGDENATYAWQLAACRRGLDCTSTGTLMSMYCMYGGICGPYANFEDLLFNGLLPVSERNKVNEMASRILSQGGS